MATCLDDRAAELQRHAAVEDLYRAETMNTPSHMLRPALSIDGNKWCALYGENLQDGVAGFGDSPHEAFRDFDREWLKKLPSKEAA